MSEFSMLGMAARSGAATARDVADPDRAVRAALAVVKACRPDLVDEVRISVERPSAAGSVAIVTVSIGEVMRRAWAITGGDFVSIEEVPA